MMIAPNSLVRQKKGAQEEEDKIREVEEKEVRQELRRQIRTLPQFKLGQGLRKRKKGKYKEMVNTR